MNKNEILSYYGIIYLTVKNLLIIIKRLNAYLIMKKLIFSILLLFSITGFSQDLNWETDFSVAKQRASYENKPILMYFTGSDWCSPCKQLKVDFFDSQKFIDKANSFILLKVDLPFRQDIISDEQRKKNKALSKKYNHSDSFPNIVGLNSRGKVVNNISAYSSLRDTTLHFNFIESLLN